MAEGLGWLYNQWLASEGHSALVSKVSVTDIHPVTNLRDVQSPGTADHSQGHSYRKGHPHHAQEEEEEAWGGTGGHVILTGHLDTLGTVEM